MRQANQPGPGVMFQPVSQPLMASPGPVGFQPNSPNKKVPALMGLSIVHVALGCLSTILGIVAIILKCNFSYVGWGLWSGVVFFGVTGILGLIGATRKINYGIVITFMVMSIISAAVAFQLLVAAAIAATRESYGYCYPGTSYHSSGPCYNNQRARVAVDSLLAITGLAEMVIAVVSASLSCYGMCSCCRSYTPVTVQYVPQQLVPMMPVQAQQQQFQQQQQQQQQLQQQQQFQQQQEQQQQQQQLQQQQQQQQIQQQQPQQAGHGFIAVNAQQQQGPPQQQPMQAPTAMQGSPIGSQYVTDYRASPTQQMANPPQQIPYVPQPVGPAAQMVIAPQPISMAPQQVVVSVPSQIAPTGPVEAGGPTAETPDANANQTGVTNSEGSEHFHHDDKEGLLETV